jgi:hypothetical protein
VAKEKTKHDDREEDGGEQENQNMVLGSVDPNTRVSPGKPVAKKPQGYEGYSVGLERGDLL